ncbi:MAG: phosphate ABC transporter substrate-binding protein [Novosphingobium sp. 28-62-57]|uniref:substrate-binding domain-containing protein n=1 Tax=unclassified Novosphingobium TaxID=2644732 RepID=UPI000BC527DF|nr:MULTISPECIES: substrate-binding domain-containing protein [unclassified Novosphingobium]OYW48945.1 MAG: phosphate ABC transporter substrate-binding protein [Novosphingobium sp. 12-62-10]OYZ09590.1 MAG: phosphate ABC transporter substrate-binding protein [Novosphingobium sp. 28-62-57]OZA34325.1 MAG: phosphate ABC transporter substrate-binding protein [Novosphingobium sp. 17-62-9]HQS68619.1 substrate-binding domain-containing protein [Novosphingobium sp.]
MSTIRTLAICAAALPALTLAGCGSQDGGTRDQVRAVGSSTVYPFAKAVAESLSRADPKIKSPIIESTGTGAGMNLFCGGVGAQFPDIANASRRMKASEFEGCQKNGVKDIVEVQVGLDGVAFAETVGGIGVKLTPEDVYKALAKNPYGKPQTYKTWKDVNPSLPAEPILVYGPPSTSGTRDALKELILAKGCDENAEMKALKDSDKSAHEKICTEVRDDGAYVDAGENDNLIVQKIEANPKAIGVFGFSYLEENKGRLNGLTMNGIMPTYESISDFSYPGARPLYIYVKKAHLKAIPGLQGFVTEWSKVWGKGGTLAKLGMVVAPDDVLANSTKAVNDLPVLDGAQLK